MKKLFTYAFVALLLSACSEEDNPASAHYEIDPTSSSVAWRGSTPEISNHGTISVNTDIITTENNRVTGGSFSLPLSSIQVLNLEGELKEQLKSHLLSTDFFNALLHPNVTFQVREVQVYSNNGEEGVVADANYAVTGELTFLDKSNTITFPAKIILTEDELQAEALITIDRLEWGMDYASDPDGEQYILPHIELHLDLTAIRR